VSVRGNALEKAEWDDVSYRRFCIGQSGPDLYSHRGSFGIFGNIAGNVPLSQTTDELIFVAFLNAEHNRLRAWPPIESLGPGILPKTAIVGDSVWILFGCKMPMVLKIVKDEGELVCQVVGPCYVKAVMWGGALRGIEVGTYESRRVVLV